MCCQNLPFIGADQKHFSLQTKAIQSANAALGKAIQSVFMPALGIEPKAGINTLYGFSLEGEMFPVGSYKWGF